MFLLIFAHESFLNFLSHKTLTANKQRIRRDSLSASFISETALFSRNWYVGFILTYFGQFRSISSVCFSSAEKQKFN